ncbi:MAG: 30S ribosomal protein S6 [Ignavibacteriaceae bacterium]|nr:30S ribosomal protein S6 [Ignavibacteriaceae bacterium]
MRISQYETAVIINAALEDSAVEAEITKIQDMIVSFGGTIVDLDKWGRKRLAYQIKKHKIGYYVIYRYDAPTEAVAKIERLLRLNESLVRFLTIKLDKFAIEHLEDQKAKRAALQVAPPDEVIELAAEPEIFEEPFTESEPEEVTPETKE